MFDLLKKKLSGFIESISAQEKERELKAELSTTQKIKAVVSKEIQLKEKDIESLLFELELSLLEADVSQETSEALISKIKERLTSRKFQAKNLNEELQKEIKETLFELIKTSKIDLISCIKEKKEKPFKILFLGPNGAGKTTTIAKIAFLLQSHGFKSMFSASDTFRAASIEQLEEHARKLNIPIIKKGYNADPTAVAFDAINSAKAHNIHVVLIDSAGRQETNKNLMNELKKIVRVINPDLRIFIGESIAGKTLLEQAKEFNKELFLDCFILTKTDIDKKGGSIISLLFELKKPILFIGSGQNYDDLNDFNEKKLIEELLY